MYFMTLRKSAVSAAVVLGALASVYGCEQPLPKCVAAHNPYMAVYKPLSGPPECAELKGEKIGFGTYNPPGTDGKPDYNVALLAVQAEAVGARFDIAPDPEPANRPYQLGNFRTPEPVNDICEVVFPQRNGPARQDFPAYPENIERKRRAEEAGSVTYEWSKMRFFVTALSLGTQFSAELTRTANGVACTYKVVGLSPYVECNKSFDDTEARARKCIFPDVKCDAHKRDRTPDNSKCLAEPDAAAGRPTGSGISPDFPTKCDPDLLTCVLTKDVLPALK